MQRKSFVRAIAGAALSLSAPKEAEASCGSEYHAAIYDAAARYNVSGDYMIQVMCCESGGNPNALNPRTGDSGLFQYNPNTWYSWGGGDIWNPYEQIELTAWAFSQGLDSHWCCSAAWQGGTCQ